MKDPSFINDKEGRETFSPAPITKKFNEDHMKLEGYWRLVRYEPEGCKEVVRCDHDFMLMMQVLLALLGLLVIPGAPI